MVAVRPVPLLPFRSIRQGSTEPADAGSNNETENRKEIDMKTESEVRERIYSELNQMGFWIDERENVKRKKPANSRVKMPRINERLFQLCCWILRND